MAGTVAQGIKAAGAQKKNAFSENTPVIDEKMRRRMAEDQLAADIIDECRVQLMLKFRFLDLALWRMNLEPMRVSARHALFTNGKKVFYDPPLELARFQESFEEAVRDYLHLVMHCIFRHPFDGNHPNKEAWSLACDIVVENAVMDMCGGRFESADDPQRRQEISEIMLLAGQLMPNKVYRIIRGVMDTPDGQHYHGMSRSKINIWRDLFERDEHGAWEGMMDPNEANETTDSQEVTEDDFDPEMQQDSIHADSPEDVDPDDDGQNQQETHQTQSEQEVSQSEQEESGGQDDPDDPEKTDDGDMFDQQMQKQADEGNEPQPDREEIEVPEKEWEEIAKQIEMNLETFSQEWGEEAGSLMANLAIANRKMVDYGDFLRRFMIVNEEMRLNQDEFDYIYYTYGMELYGNMPLVEPLEYKETNTIRDFAIVIDTSESVSGPLVKKFISHTFDILKESEDFATEINVHIIQCDSRVQSDTKITKLKDVDKMMEGFTVRGFGGTDFRPAFDYVDYLRKRGELSDLKGLIYFTDGIGQFPEKGPDFDAAFVFMDDEGRKLPPVPPWAMKIVIDEAGINSFKSKTRA